MMITSSSVWPHCILAVEALHEYDAILINTHVTDAHLKCHHYDKDIHSK